MLGLVPLAAVLVSACSSSDAAETTSAPDPGSSALDLDALDRTVDPCTDFYAFACNGADKSADKDRALARAETMRLAALKAALAKAFAAPPQTPAEEKARTLYQACLRADPYLSPSPASYAARRTAVRAATDARSLATALGSLALQRTAPFAKLSTYTYARTRVPYVEALPGFAPVDASTDALRAALVAQRKATVLASEPGIDDAEATSLAEGAVRFEAALSAALTAAPAADSDAEDVGTAGLAAAAPRVDWAAFFEALGAPTLPADYEVFGLRSLAALNAALGATTLSDVTAFVVLAIYRTGFPAAPGDDQESRCRFVTAQLMSDAVVEGVARAAGLDSAALAAFGERIRAAAATVLSSSFLDAPSREAALAKLAAMRIDLGVSTPLDDYASLSFDGTDDFTTMELRAQAHRTSRDLAGIGQPAELGHIPLPLTVTNAFHYWGWNASMVQLSEIARPLYAPTAARLSNYAGLGAVVGHEVFHGFDSNGRDYDEGGAQPGRWSAASLATYDERNACLVDQYASFSFVDPLTGAPHATNGAATLAENLADNGGIRAAYAAWKAEGAPAPEVPGFTPEQQFFVTYAQSWCGLALTQTEGEDAAVQHAPNRARVNVVLADMPEAAKAFACAPGTALAPANRCTVW